MSQTFTAADADEIRRLSGIHRAALLAHDPLHYLTTCTDDITFIPPDGDEIAGRDAAHAFLEDFPHLADMEVTVEEVEGSGTLAFSRGRARATMEGKEVLFRWMAIHRRGDDGRWRMARDQWSFEA